MLYKSLVSFIAAFTMASTVAVSANPVARGGGTCNTGSVQCCNQITNGGNPTVAALAALLNIVVSPTAVVGLTCTSVISADQCNNSPVCCDHVYQNGLLDVGCTSVNVGA